MPRVARQNQHVPGQLAHVMSRFVDGRFLVDETARRVYLRFLAIALSRTDWLLLSYSVMTTHIHLGLLMGWQPLESWAQPMHTRFAIWMTRHLRLLNPHARGHIFADRPRSKLVPLERALPLVTYHHRNPLEAGLVKDPARSTWTSHRPLLGYSVARGGLDVARSLELCGYDTTVQGRRGFHEYVSRTAVTAEELGLVDKPLPPPGREWTRSPAEIFARACSLMGIAVKDAAGGWNRKAPAVLARRVALLVAARAGTPARAMADELFISPSNASRQLAQGLRDEAALALANELLAPEAA